MMNHVDIGTTLIDYTTTVHFIEHRADIVSSLLSLGQSTRIVRPSSVGEWQYCNIQPYPYVYFLKNQTSFSLSLSLSLSLYLYLFIFCHNEFPIRSVSDQLRNPRCQWCKNFGVVPASGEKSLQRVRATVEETRGERPSSSVSVVFPPEEATG